MRGWRIQLVQASLGRRAGGQAGRQREMRGSEPGQRRTVVGVPDARLLEVDGARQHHHLPRIFKLLLLLVQAELSIRPTQEVVNLDGATAMEWEGAVGERQRPRAMVGGARRSGGAEVGAGPASKAPPALQAWRTSSRQSRAA